MTFSLKGSLGLDARDFEEGAKKASGAIGDVADKLDDVGKKDPRPRIGVDDNATDELERLDRKLQGLDGEERTIKLNAEASRLDAVIKKADRDLQTLDGQAARPTLDMRNKASAQLDEVKRQLEQEIPDAADKGGKEAGESLTERLGSGMQAQVGKLGAGVGGAYVAAIGLAYADGMGRLQLAATFETEFGAINERAETLGEEASRIWANGWGESKDQVVEALGRVDQRLVRTGEVAAQESEKIAEGALIIAQVWGEDVSTVIEATSKMLLNDLAPSSEAAMDVMASAMQQGAGSAGDLFESVDEYSQHFAAFGLSAEDMMVLFVDGMQNGQRDTDKLADAVKEMRIRSVEDTDAINDAYKDLGLSADEMRTKIMAGGPAAREAFIEIIAAIQNVDDPVERTRLSIELMGTQIEDLGPAALDSFGQIGTATLEAEGTVDSLNGKLSESTSQTEILQRRVSELAGTFTEELATGINRALDDPGSWETLSGNVGNLKDELEGVRSQADIAAVLESFGITAASTGISVESLTRELGLAYVVLPPFTAEQEAANEKMGQAADAARLAGLAQKYKSTTDKDAKKSADDHAQAMEDEAAAAEELTGATEELTTAKADLVGGDIAVSEATRDAADAIDDMNAVMADSEATARDQARAFDDATEAQLRAASSAADYEIAQREATGEVLSASQQNAIYRQELARVAEGLAPGSALRARLEGYIADMDAIPESVTSDIAANTGQAREDVAAHQRALDLIPREITTNVKVRTATSAGARAEGGPVDAGGMYWVGEEGPELVSFGHDGYVHNASESAAMSAQSPMGPVMSAGSSAGPTLSPGLTEVFVQIGDRELRDIVRTEIRRDRAEEMVRR